MIDDKTAAQARLVLMTWFAEHGAQMSTHFAVPTGDEGCFPDPLGLVMTRGQETTAALRGWADGQKEKMTVIPTSPALSPLRAPLEIHRAHDMLWALKMDQNVRSRISVGGDELKLITAALDVLCWVLRHDHNSTFADNLRSLNEQIEAAGLRLEPLPEGGS